MQAIGRTQAACEDRQPRPDAACSAGTSHSTIGIAARERGPEAQEHRVVFHPDNSTEGRRLPHESNRQPGARHQCTRSSSPVATTPALDTAAVAATACCEMARNPVILDCAREPALECDRRHEDLLVTADSRNVSASRALIRTGCLALALLITPVWGQSLSTAAATFSSEIDAKCPEAVREVAELRSRTNAPRAPRTVTRPALRQNLLLMAKQDQEARAFSISISSGGRIDPVSPEVVRMREVDSANLKRLKHIVIQEGFPTAEMVGLDGVNAAWLMAIHAGSDPDFQEKVLKLTRDHVRRGEVRSDQVALLTDNLLAGRGKPQRYGTNFDLHDGELIPAPMEDEANVDKIRRAFGLGSLANYACVIRASYGSPKPQGPRSSAAAQ